MFYCPETLFPSLKGIEFSSPLLFQLSSGGSADRQTSISTFLPDCPAFLHPVLAERLFHILSHTPIRPSRISHSIPNFRHDRTPLRLPGISTAYSGRPASSHSPHFLPHLTSIANLMVLYSLKAACHVILHSSCLSCHTPFKLSGMLYSIHAVFSIIL